MRRLFSVPADIFIKKPSNPQEANNISGGAIAGADEDKDVSLMSQGTFALDFARVLCGASTLFCAR